MTGIAMNRCRTDEYVHMLEDYVEKLMEDTYTPSKAREAARRLGIDSSKIWDVFDAVANHLCILLRDRMTLDARREAMLLECYTPRLGRFYMAVCKPGGVTLTRSMEKAVEIYEEHASRMAETGKRFIEIDLL